MDILNKELIGTIAQKVSFFLVILAVMSGFAWMQHYLLSHKKPWLWSLGVSIAFIALFLLLFEKWGLSLRYFSVPEALIYLLVALCVFTAIAVVNSIQCLKLLKVSLDQLALIIAGGLVVACFVGAALYFAAYPVSNVLAVLKRVTFISALCALATSLMVLLLEANKK